MLVDVGQANITNIHLNTTLHHIPPSLLSLPKAQESGRVVFCYYPLTSWPLQPVIILHNLHSAGWLYCVLSDVHRPNYIQLSRGLT